MLEDLLKNTPPKKPAQPDGGDEIQFQEIVCAAEFGGEGCKAPEDEDA